MLPGAGAVNIRVNSPAGGAADGFGGSAGAATGALAGAAGFGASGAGLYSNIISLSIGINGQK
jgi:hypothetical protein